MDNQNIDSEDKLHYESGFDYSINEEKVSVRIRRVNNTQRFSCSEIHNHTNSPLIGIHTFDFSKADKSTVSKSDIFSLWLLIRQKVKMQKRSRMRIYDWLVSL